MVIFLGLCICVVTQMLIMISLTVSDIPKESVCRGERRDRQDFIMHVFHRPKNLTDTASGMAVFGITKDGTKHLFVDPNCLSYEKSDPFGMFYNPLGNKPNYNQNGFRGCVAGTFFTLENTVAETRTNGNCVANMKPILKALRTAPFVRSSTIKRPEGTMVHDFQGIGEILDNVQISTLISGFMICLPDMVLLAYPNNQVSQNSYGSTITSPHLGRLWNILLPPGLSITGVPPENYNVVRKKPGGSFPGSNQAPREYVKYLLRTSEVENLNVGECFIYPDSGSSVCFRNNGRECGLSSICKTNQAYIGVDDWVEAIDFKGPQKTCKCHEGYAMTPEDVCQDIDECSMGTHTCKNNITMCANINGGYKCFPKHTPLKDEEKSLCSEGYEYVVNACVDKDECKAGVDDCDHATTDCVNLLGSYRCDCKNNIHEHTTSQSTCGPVTYEYRLLDPSLVTCCHHAGNGMFLMWGRKMFSGNYTHLSRAGCLMLSPHPLPPDYHSSSLSMYQVRGSNEGVKTKLEAESLALFSDLFQDRINKGLADRVIETKKQLYTVIQVGNRSCFSLYTKPVPSRTPEGNSVLVQRETSFVLIDATLDTYISGSTPGSCSSLPTNVVWLASKLKPKPPENPKLYSPLKCLTNGSEFLLVQYHMAAAVVGLLMIINNAEIINRYPMM